MALAVVAPLLAARYPLLAWVAAWLARDLPVVGQAADGADAVSQARQLEPGVVLMDVRMPVMDGLQPQEPGPCAGPRPLITSPRRL